MIVLRPFNLLKLYDDIVVMTFKLFKIMKNHIFGEDLFFDLDYISQGFFFFFLDMFAQEGGEKLFFFRRDGLIQLSYLSKT
jgi:hypothetical protein